MSFISILIPTKDYTKGLVRLLENLPKNKSYVKIIISDDSVSGEIESYVKKLKFDDENFYSEKLMGIYWQRSGQSVLARPYPRSSARLRSVQPPLLSSMNLFKCPR